jgi:catechol-2,3-dioxygenase
MQPIRIDHVSLNVADRARSLTWYQEVVGLDVGTEGPPDEPVFMGPDGARIALFADRAPGLRHFALATDAAGRDALIERLERAGVPLQRAMHSTGESIYFRDPDGHTLEVFASAQPDSA